MERRMQGLERDEGATGVPILAFAETGQAIEAVAAEARRGQGAAPDAAVLVMTWADYEAPELPAVAQR
jgi:hypothetical protein